MLGSIVALTFGLPELLGTKDKWAYLPLLPLPLLFLEIFWLFRVPDSPLYLIERRHSKTTVDKSLEFYLGHKIDGDAEEDLEQKKLNQDEKNAKNDFYSDKSRLFTTVEGRKLLFLWLALSLLASFAGASLTNNYSTAILGNFKKFSPITKYSSLIINVIKLMLVLVALYVIDKIGRRALLLCSAWLVTFCYMILITISFFGDSNRNKTLTYMKIWFVLVWTATQYIVNSTAVLIVSESSRQNMRAFSLASFKLVFHISSVILTIIFPPMVHFSESLAYLIIGTPCFILCVYLTSRCPETGYRNLLHDDECDGTPIDANHGVAARNEQTPLIYSEITPSNYTAMKDENYSYSSR